VVRHAGSPQRPAVRPLHRDGAAERRNEDFRADQAHPRRLHAVESSRCRNAVAMKRTLGAAFAAGVLSMSVPAVLAAAEILPATGKLGDTTMQRLLLVDATRIGNRVVAVGDRGYIVYSDDNGMSWSRAKAPAAPLLTAVEFVDAKLGWAVGHDSVI